MRRSALCPIRDTKLPLPTSLLSSPCYLYSPTSLPLISLYSPPFILLPQISYYSSLHAPLAFASDLCTTPSNPSLPYLSTLVTLLTPTHSLTSAFISRSTPLHALCYLRSLISLISLCTPLRSLSPLRQPTLPVVGAAPPPRVEPSWQLRGSLVLQTRRGATRERRRRESCAADV